MKNIKALTIKEFVAYFKLPIAYVFIVIFLMILNWLFFQDFFLRGEVNIRSYFELLPLMFLLLTPAISMRLWAEEKSQKTEELLLTLPISDWEAVLGKFFGSLLFLLICLIFSLTVPLSLSFLGRLDLGLLLSGYFGAVLLGGFYLSIGLFISSLSKNQIIAFMVTLAVCFFFYIIGTAFVLETSPKILTSTLQFLGVTVHFANFARGVVGSQDLIYFLTLTFYFLFLNKEKIESRLWK